jgi:polyhydroxyalkanoate synthesis regulator phasin
VGVSENGDPGASARSALSVQQLLLAGVGWASLGVEALDAVADELGRRVGVGRDEMRTAVRDTVESWKREGERVGVRGDAIAERAWSRVGVVRQESHDELELRVAQLEHRLRLLERTDDPPAT